MEQWRDTGTGWHSGVHGTEYRLQSQRRNYRRNAISSNAKAACKLRQRMGVRMSQPAPVNELLLARELQPASMHALCRYPTHSSLVTHAKCRQELLWIAGRPPDRAGASPAFWRDAGASALSSKTFGFSRRLRGSKIYRAACEVAWGAGRPPSWQTFVPHAQAQSMEDNKI